MCRLFGLSGGPERVSATFWLLTAPDSLSEQSRREPDGTGIGAYDAHGRPFVDKQPLAAWEDRRFAQEARRVKSRTVVAHVRYASTGELTVRNTHPFQLDDRLFAHNGVLQDLPALERELGPDLQRVQGDTDSERFFALITREIEHSGDAITAEIFGLINRTFVTPFEREDLIALGSIIDTVLDQIDEVATMLVLYNVPQPSVYLLEASTLLSRAVDELVAAIDLLESLKGLHPHVEEVHRLEQEADQLYYNAVAELFLPDAYTPLDVVKWKSLYDLMERAFDKCEDAANVLENVVIKNG